MRWLNNLGPGLLVTAAFIGPGTVATASKAGAEYGPALAWALVFAVFTTVVLQEMAARLGLVTRQGLAESIRTTFRSRAARVPATVLVVSAIGLGAAAFQTGNILGASVGLEAITGVSPRAWAPAVGAGAFCLLLSSAYRILERVLVLLVLVMSAVFLLTAIAVAPRLSDMFAGFVPRLPSEPPGALVTVLALVGTTVVPYNLFLHSSAVREKWPPSLPVDQALKRARFDTCLSISLGGAITLAIMLTAVASFFLPGRRFDGLLDMATALEPLLGPAARYFFAVGLVAAGLTSAITAPLAGAYATSGVLGWEPNLRSWRFRAVWALIIVVGAFLAFFLGRSPVQTIVFAQTVNGILLPLIALFLLVVMNRRGLLGRYRNGAVANGLGALVVLIASGLGIFQLLRAFGAG